MLVKSKEEEETATLVLVRMLGLMFILIRGPFGNTGAFIYKKVANLDRWGRWWQNRDSFLMALQD